MDKVSVPILVDGEFTGRAKGHIDRVVAGGAKQVIDDLRPLINGKADQSALDEFLRAVDSRVSESDAKTALGSIDSKLATERVAREEADIRLAGRVTALEEAEPDLSGYATKEELGKALVGVPVFATREQALSYEMANPGEQALYFDSRALGAFPSTPGVPEAPVATVNDYTYQWLGSIGASATSWTDTKQKLALSSQGIASVSGGAVKFTGTQFFKAPLPLMTGAEQTWVMVYRIENPASSGSILTSTGGASGRVAFAPSLGNQPLTQLDTWSSSGLPAADTSWHVGIIRWYGSATSIRVDDAEKLARDARVIDASTITSGYPGFTIGGFYNNGFKGEVKEVRLYNRAISDDEATQLVSSLRGQYGIS